MILWSCLLALMSEKVISEKSFTWMRMLRYHMDVRNVLRAKQEPVDPAPPPVQSEHQYIRRASRATSRKTMSYTSTRSRKESVGKLTQTKALFSLDSIWIIKTLMNIKSVFQMDCLVIPYWKMPYVNFIVQDKYSKGHLLDLQAGCKFLLDN